MKLFLPWLLFGFSLFAQISPGDLSKAHAKFEGLSNCTKCHVLGEQVYNSKCLDCHKEIQELQNLNRGFHASSDVKGKNCWSCHSEHHGRNFQIIRFDKNNFDHNKTKFELTGKHSKIKCEDCHQQKFIKDPELKNKKGTFLGLDLKCQSCHEDYHQNSLGNECSSCHNTEAFRPAPKFNHEKTNFKLAGAHEKVQCISCHPKEKKNGKDFQKFKGLLFSSCVNCHKDIHEGKFGNDCKRCHETASFKNINKEAFDHNKTNFPLVGKHQSVSCNSCHKTNLSTKPKHEKCIDCHSDYHKGDFTVEREIKDCSVCHTLEGFKPSTFTFKEHEKTKFPLTGSHFAVPCQSCHFKNQEWHFKKIGMECTDCHKNIHGEEIVENFGGKKCASCHVTENWITILFEHGKTEFPLLGKHKNLSCGNCHYKEKKEFKFASLRNECSECHKDIHFGQFGQACINCHQFENWKPEKFDHNKTKFSLDGAHQKVDCSACHKKAELNGNYFTKYKIENFKCADCHS